MTRSRAVPACAAILAAALLGCGATAYNVRAYRAYTYEEAKLHVAIDRAEDLAVTAALLNRILIETPYTPGAEWIGKLPLTDAEANRIRSQLRSRAPYDNTDYNIPLVKVYRVHLEEVLEQAPKPAARGSSAGAEGERAQEPGDDAGTGEGGAVAEGADADADAGAPAQEQKPAGEFASIFAAMASLTPKGESLVRDWDAAAGMREELEKLEAKKTAMLPSLPVYGSRPFSASERERLAEYDALKEQIDAAEKRLDDAKRRMVAAVETMPEPGDDRKQQIVRDAETAVSVAYRLELEALALLPVIVVQAARATLAIGKEGSRRPLKLMRLESVTELPGYLSKMEERLDWQHDVLEPAAERLAKLRGHDVDQTPGFKLRESLVDQIAGITRDSFRLDMNAGGEALFFSQSALTKDAQSTNASSTSSSKTTTHDFTGRTHRLIYDVRPIYMVSGNVNVAFDWFHLPDAAKLNLGYRTDRAFSSGGSIENSGSLGQQLGVKGRASDVLDAGLGLLGVQTAVRVARFTTGTVTEMGVDPGTDQDAGIWGTAPMQMQVTQVDVGYDIAFLFAQTAGKFYIEKVVLGARHLRYSMPRILYEMRDTNTSADRDDYVFVRESPAQTVQSKYWMGGVTSRWGPGESPRLGWYFDLAILAGAGPASYYLLYDQTGSDVPENREQFHKTAIVANVGMGLGFRYRITGAASRFKLDAQASYRGDLIYSSISLNSPGDKNGVEQGEKRELTFGGVDVFHGPRFAVVGAF
ncbi:MAG TPA: hypothetical protein PLI95_01915 [Polyangiaceae bacterium]|nr:hypothetical protein [Polyangiaceae bacterium]